ncbi:hypothetical protein R1flu_022931 [Riccia fluitans]|uniref:Uncharacterized protein n=1 Tax=Riccia fluitans TaxID=41844 RepID=A0ABD1XQM1_9MARC
MRAQLFNTLLDDTREIDDDLGSVFTTVDLKQTVRVDSDIEIQAYYAGHVLGANMFYVKVGDDSCVYTGGCNMTPDRHSGAAQSDAIQPDLLISK